ncbi:hypothetical protein [Botrimarina colliarenosi]|nr:hypothetical protein [Botrimarina colliarenosi]
MATVAPASASILDDFNAATLIADFRFDDTAGTKLEDAANAVDPLNKLGVDADFNDAVTDGAGKYDGSGKANTEQGASYLDVGNITSGKLYLLFDVAWAFDESIYDPSQDEEFRVSLMRDNASTASTFVTAENNFRRDSATTVSLFGNAVGTGSSDTPSISLGSSGDMLTILVADLDAQSMELFYSTDDGSSFTSLGTGSLDPSRGVQSLRFVLNEDFSNDSLLVDRIAYALVPEPAAAALLTIAVAMAGVARRTSDR